MLQQSALNKTGRRQRCVPSAQFPSTEYSAKCVPPEWSRKSLINQTLVLSDAHKNALLKCNSYGKALLWCKTRRRGFNALPDQIFPEITIKTRAVTHRLIQGLRRNLRIVLRRLNSQISVTGDWDLLEVQTPDDNKILVRFWCTRMMAPCKWAAFTSLSAGFQHPTDKLPICCTTKRA
jgi:hypothetical protein